jgi:hypothetical protein
VDVDAGVVPDGTGAAERRIVIDITPKTQRLMTFPGF